MNKNQPAITPPVVNFERYEEFKVKISQLVPFDLNFGNMTLTDYELLVMTIYRLNELISIVNMYSTTIDEVLEWVINDGLQESVLKQLNVWLLDGTLEVLINETLFNTKLDKIDFEDYKLLANQNLEDLEENISNLDNEVTVQLVNTGVQVPLSATTTEIQSILDNNTIVRFLGGTYVFDKPVFGRSNSHIVFSPTTIFKAKSGAFTGLNDVMWTFKDTTNVKLTGSLRISMNKSEYTEGEWRSGLSLLSVKNFEADTIYVSDTGGDGVYFGKTSEGTTNENIKIIRIVADNNKRNGVSFITGKNIHIDTIISKNTNGTSPEFGVDFEPNYNDEILENIVVENIYTENNAQGGLLFAIGKLKDSLKDTSITVNNFYSTNDGYVSGLKFGYNNAIGDTSQLSGFIKVKGKIFNPKGKGIEFFNYSSKAIPIELELTVENPGTDTNLTSIEDLAGVYMQTYGDNTAEKVGNITFNELKVIDDRPTPRLSIPVYMPSSARELEKVLFRNFNTRGQTNESNGPIVVGKGETLIRSENLPLVKRENSLSVRNFQGTILTNNTDSAKTFTLPLASDFPRSTYRFKHTVGAMVIQPDVTEEIVGIGKGIGGRYVLRNVGDYLELTSDGKGWEVTDRQEKVFTNLDEPNYVGQQAIVNGNVYIATGSTNADWVQVNNVV